MKTSEEIAKFHAQLEAAGISLTSLPAHCAISEFKDESNLVSNDDLVKFALSEENKNHQLWIDLALAPWCKRHGITLEQGASIVARDDSYNPENPSQDLVTHRSLFAWRGEQNHFAQKVLKNAESLGPTEITLHWHLDDVFATAKNSKSEIKPTENQAREVLKRVALNHSATEGVSWDFIAYHLEEVLADDSDKDEPTETSPTEKPI